ncbi:MAG TPA: dihydrolipoamide acetyltransferase family protein [Steroidobacter sp.]|uniref:dihydrolipoamide acetyltransferase family protein n=1 Tax=Steroidobacter sp. TaxID=1978227 RepID=UPI002ED7AE5D
MARFLFRLPDIGEGITQAEIVTWHVKAGQRIAEDQSLLDVMTDKATVEMTSPVAGVVVATHGEPGELVAVGATLVEFEVEGEGEQSAPVQPETPKVAASKPAEAKAPVAAPVDVPKREKPARSTESRPHPATATATPLASPAVRRRAYELGIPLQFVTGTAAAGRITEQDLQDYIDRGSSVPATDRRYEKRTGVRDTKLIGLRRRIAEKMQESKRRIPHFGYVEEFDMTELEALRKELNEQRDESRPKLTLLPFFMRAVVALVPEFPNFNARYDDEAGVLQTHDGVHIGIATQSSQGLMVPVVRHAEARDLWDCARELARVTSAARNGTATRDELSGSTITLTSLGALGGISATPVINHPEVAIIGPNKLVERPVVRNGRLEFRLLMNVSCAFDHRIIDGHEAARFVQRMRRLIERPVHLFVD